MILANLTRKLDSVTLGEWSERSLALKRNATFKKFHEFLEIRATYLESFPVNNQRPRDILANNQRPHNIRTNNQRQHRMNPPIRQPERAVAHMVSASSACLVCPCNHSLLKYKEFKELSIE